MWNLYSMLNAEQKRLAKSDMGLPLGLFDTGWMADYIRSERSEYDKPYRSVAMPDRGLELDRALSSPDLLASVSLKLAREPAEGKSVLAKHNYSLVLESYSDGVPKTLLSEGLDGISFPVYTPEREAELVKKAEVNGAEK